MWRLLGFPLTVIRCSRLQDARFRQYLAYVLAEKCAPWHILDARTGGRKHASGRRVSGLGLLSNASVVEQRHGRHLGTTAA